jgi:hypothetical protein
MMMKLQVNSLHFLSKEKFELPYLKIIHQIFQNRPPHPYSLPDRVVS